ncbi:MAG: DsbA family protein [Pseudomonadota bacterium]
MSNASAAPIPPEHGVLEVFYSAHSAFAFIGFPAMAALAAKYGLRVSHRLMELSPVMEAGGAQKFADRSTAHKDYFFGTEVDRWAAHRGLPIVNHRPTHHDADYGFAAKLILAAQALQHQATDVNADALHADALAFAILQFHWQDDGDLSDEAALIDHLEAAGFPLGSAVETARSPDIASRYAQNTKEAIERSVFGSPTYFVNGEMFYGQDRLDLIDWRLSQPAK